MTPDEHFDRYWKKIIIKNEAVNWPVLKATLLDYTALHHSMTLLITAITGLEAKEFNYKDTDEILERAEEHTIDRLNEQALELISRFAVAYKLSEKEINERVL